MLCVRNDEAENRMIPDGLAKHSGREEHPCLFGYQKGTAAGSRFFSVFCAETRKMGNIYCEKFVIVL
jgi:hypothetical protein